MLSPLRTLRGVFTTAKQISPSEPRGPTGHRAYIIGDVHGCFDQLEKMLMAIEVDNAGRQPCDTHIVFLGDLIDRGPDSFAVIERLKNYAPSFAQVTYLMGNHEEVLINILKGNARLLEPWFNIGGRACARSYGVQNLGAVLTNPQSILRQLRRNVPLSHMEFLSTFGDMWRFGDYLCVHAGINPKNSPEKQKQRDLRWIRSPFLNYDKPYGFVVVHGHTVVNEPSIHHNRIAIDTGVYKSGVLTCLMLEGGQKHIISTSPE